MNIFRFLGDMSHILSFIVLLHKIIKGKSSVGISLRTQEMYMGACACPLEGQGLCMRDAHLALPPQGSRHLHTAQPLDAHPMRRPPPLSYRTTFHLPSLACHLTVPSSSCSAQLSSSPGTLISSGTSPPCTIGS